MSYSTFCLPEVAQISPVPSYPQEQIWRESASSYFLLAAKTRRNIPGLGRSQGLCKQVSVLRSLNFSANFYSRVHGLLQEGRGDNTSGCNAPSLPQHYMGFTRLIRALGPGGSAKHSRQRRIAQEHHFLPCT